MHQTLPTTNTHLHFTAVIINKIAGICLREQDAKRISIQIKKSFLLPKGFLSANCSPYTASNMQFYVNVGKPNCTIYTISVLPRIGDQLLFITDHPICFATGIINLWHSYYLLLICNVYHHKKATFVPRFIPFYKLSYSSKIDVCNKLSHCLY